MICYNGGDTIKEDPIAQVLDELMELDEILACMIARRNMIGSIMPSCGPEGFKSEVHELWDIIKRTMDSQLNVISEYSQTGLKKIDFQLQEYNVLFYIFPDTENALVGIIRALSNRGLVAIEMENARRKIIKIREEEEKKRLQVTA